MPQANTDPYRDIRIAVVEDDDDIRANICRFLDKSGLPTWGAASAEDFYVGCLRERADLVMLDLGLPGEDGLSLARRLTQQRVPVIMVTARAGVEDRIAGLDAGAVQYFVKPVDMHELVAGIRSLLRLRGNALEQGGLQPEWRLDRAMMRLVAPNQRAMDLTDRELELVTCLLAAEGSLVSKQSVVDFMCYGDVDGAFHRIETMLTRMRRKCQDATGMILPVRAVFGRGLVFVP